MAETVLITTQDLEPAVRLRDAFRDAGYGVELITPGERVSDVPDGVIYGAAIYLAKVRGLTQAQVGALLWIPPLGWEAGYFFWGWVSDKAGRRQDPVFLGLMLLSLPLAIVPTASSR